MRHLLPACSQNSSVTGKEREEPLVFRICYRCEWIGLGEDGDFRSLV